ncbi:histidine phosphatase family protein [Leuconostoc mesenteroides]|uniref:histidine phosphatase family protein n=1 Tax=Leuconostoc mesenteroides TaxID=1245 RepID=UPI00388F3DC0
MGYFVDKNIKAIYSSPYQRALQTIEPTATTLGIEINLNAALRERQTNDQIDWQNFYFKTAGEESLATVQQRMKTAFYQIIDESSGEIFITSHGTALSLLFHYLTSGYFNFIDWQKMEMPDVYIGLFDENNQCISLTKEAY